MTSLSGIVVSYTVIRLCFNWAEIYLIVFLQAYENTIPLALFIQDGIE